MNAKTLILILTVTLFAAGISGCISAKDEVDPESDHPDPATGDGPDGQDADADASIEAPRQRDVVIHQETWIGQRALDQRFKIDAGFDHLVATFSHTGQMIGHPILEDGDGEDLDDTFTSLTSGTFHLSRTIPPTPGDGRITMSAGPALDGLVAGVGGFTIHGYTGHAPGELLHLSWTGQRIEPVILDSQVQFYVPASVERFGLDLSGTGQTTNGFRLLDPDGDERYTHGASSGPVDDDAEFDGEEGLWTLVLEGSTNGAWSLRAVTIAATAEAVSDGWA